jgi:hypothetical protein
VFQPTACRTRGPQGSSPPARNRIGAQPTPAPTESSRTCPLLTSHSSEAHGRDPTHGPHVERDKPRPMRFEVELREGGWERWWHVRGGDGRSPSHRCARSKGSCGHRPHIAARRMLHAVHLQLGFCHTWSSQNSLPRTLSPHSEQTHPQNSRFTPGCSSVVLWTPCSGVWRVFEPTLEKRHDGQAACEPGGGGCGGVPVHPARLHIHRASPTHELLTS